ncbi:DUF2716 domain-containing protein [Arachidicoccus sp.]|uniref:DUF2716 domain-containing protein n=1 Tax=Arachidicoccus sp. TaxID=1872624 RepID=UPI003D1DD5C5
MNNWRLLDNKEFTLAWDFVYEKLLFQPYEKDKKLLKPPMVSKCFDISMFYNDGFNEDLYKELHDYMLECFQNTSNFGDRIFVLDWQHSCYSFDSRLPFEKNEFGEWLIPVFPNGDFLFFLTKDFKNGIFADGVNLKITFWGNQFIDFLNSKDAGILSYNCE